MLLMQKTEWDAKSVPFCRGSRIRGNSFIPQSAETPAGGSSPRHGEDSSEPSAPQDHTSSELVHEFAAGLAFVSRDGSTHEETKPPCRSSRTPRSHSSFFLGSNWYQKEECIIFWPKSKNANLWQSSRLDIQILQCKQKPQDIFQPRIDNVPVFNLRHISCF